MNMLGTSAPLGAAHLQNLAWLGENGQVYTVKQQQNGIHPMLGASAPLGAAHL